MFISFITFVHSLCTKTIETKMGAFHIQEIIDPGEVLCINITQYPFFIVFYDVDDKVSYSEYYSRSPNRETNRDYFANGSRVPVFRAIELPYGSISLSSIEHKRVSFTYAALPGYCQTGAYFSSHELDTITLTPHLRDFYKLSNYEDKCFIFSAPTSQLFFVKQTSSDPLDRVFIHETYTNFSSYAGTFSYSGQVGNVFEAPFIRILTNRGKPPSSVSITFRSQESSAPRPLTGTHIPRGKNINCEKVHHWYSEELVIMLICCSSFFALILILFALCSFVKCQ